MVLSGDRLKAKDLWRDAGYDPFKQRNLPNAFAKVKDAKSAIRFVERYGFLGYASLKSGLDADDQRWQEDEEDLLPWILGQADTVRFALDIIGMLEHGTLRELRNTLKSRQVSLTESEITEQLQKLPIVGWGAEGPPNVTFRYNCTIGLETLDHYYSAWKTRGRFMTWDEDRVRSHAAELLTALVNRNTAHVRPVFFCEGNDRLQMTYDYRALIEVIWHHIGNMAMMSQEGTGVRIGVCHECGSLFVASRRPREGHPEFCPPEMYEGKGSRCGLRHRMRERRERMKRKGK